MKRYYSALLLVLAVSSAFAAPATLEEGIRLKNAQQLSQSAMIFKQVLSANPDNVAALEQLAIVESWMNQYDDSIATWNRVLQIDPNRTGALVAKARVLYWKGDRNQSLEVLNQQLRRNPNDYDALVLRGDVLLAEEQFTAARQSYLQAQRTGHGDADLTKKLSNAAEPPKWRIDAGVAIDHFDNERGTENGEYVQAGYSITPHDGVYFHYDHLKEFGVTDNSYWIGGYGLIGSAVSLMGEFSVTPNPYFRPSTLFNVNAEFVSSKVWQPLLGVRYMHYDTKPIPNTTAIGGKGNVTTVTPGIRYIIEGVGNIEVKYGYTHNIDSSNTGVAQARFNIDPVGDFSPYVAIAHGKEALPPQPAATFTVLSGGGVYQINSRWSARVDLAYEDRTDFYKHFTVALGGSAKF
jgi:YaiO family outer membrane protein